MLIIIGEAQAAPGRRDQMLEAVTAMATATKSDDGCVSYGFYADVTRPEVILGVEVWRDQAALDAHMTLPTPRTSSPPFPAWWLALR